MNDMALITDVQDRAALQSGLCHLLPPSHDVVFAMGDSIAGDLLCIQNTVCKHKLVYSAEQRCFCAKYIYLCLRLDAGPKTTRACTTTAL